MTRLRCERCSFSFAPRSPLLLIEHCPRCLARGRVAVPLVAVEEAAVPRGPSPARVRREMFRSRPSPGL